MQRAWHMGGRLVSALVLAAVPASERLQAAPAPQSRSTEAAPATETVRPEDAALRLFVGQLDADTLQLRQQASEQLLVAGDRAIGPLVAALPRASAETTMRGLAILKKLAQSFDGETSHQARAALEQLARLDERSLAAQAGSILKALDPPRSTIRAPGQVVGIQGGFRMFQVQMINGPDSLRRVVAHENGQTISITESPRDGIVVTITDRVNDRDQTTTIVARNRGDLEAKNPQAAALYRKYMAGGGLGFPGGKPLVPGPLVAPGVVIPPRPFRGLEKPRPAPPVQKP